MQDNHNNDYIIEDKSVKTAHFADVNPSIVTTQEMKSNYTSNFGYHLVQQMQNPKNTSLLPYIKYYMDFALTNRSLPSPINFNQAIKSLQEAQNSFFISIDFDRYNNRILALVKVANDYCLINYSLAEDKESFYTIRTTELLIFDAKYYSPFNAGAVIIVGTDRAFMVDLHDFESLGPSIIDIRGFAATNQSDMPYKTPQLKKIFAIKNATSVAISKGNSFMVFYSPFSKLIYIQSHVTSETKTHRLSHYVDTIVFSQINTEIVVLYDSKRLKRAITILNLKKGYTQTLDISSSLIKRECNYRKINYNKSEELIVSLAGKSDKLIISKSGCLIVYENANYDLNYFDLIVGPMHYRFKSILNISEKLVSDSDALIEQHIKIETSPNSELVAVYTGRYKNKLFNLHLCVYDINTNNLFKRVISEGLNDSGLNDEYLVFSRFGDYPLVSVSNIYNKKYFVLIKKTGAKQLYGDLMSHLVKMFQIDGFSSL